MVGLQERRPTILMGESISSLGAGAAEKRECRTKLAAGVRLAVEKRFWGWAG